MSQKKITIDVVFRYNKKFNVVEMFYYDEHKNLICFSMSEGHGEACYDYYLSTQHTNNPDNMFKGKTKLVDVKEAIEQIIKYYEDDNTKLRVMKRLKIGVCSY